MEISRQDEGVVRLQGALHISEVDALRSALLGELEASTALELDLSGVDSCDTASFQMLCSLRKSAEKNGKQLRISAPSGAMREAGAILGLSLQELAFFPQADKTEKCEV